MTRESFEKILMDNEIWWNNMVELEVFNPYYKKILFGPYPKTITFVGALGYRENDPNVSLRTEGDDGPWSTKVLYFDFNQIVGIRKIKS